MVIRFAVDIAKYINECIIINSLKPMTPQHDTTRLGTKSQTYPRCVKLDEYRLSCSHKVIIIGCQMKDIICQDLRRQRETEENCQKGERSSFDERHCRLYCVGVGSKRVGETETSTQYCLVQYNIEPTNSQPNQPTS